MDLAPGGAHNGRRKSPLDHRPLNWEISLPLQAHLQGGDWVDLVPDGAPGPPESKWCANRMRPWLCVAPHADATPGVREAEEFIEARVFPLNIYQKKAPTSDSKWCANRMRPWLCVGPAADVALSGGMRIDRIGD